MRAGGLGLIPATGGRSRESGGVISDDVCENPRSGVRSWDLRLRRFILVLSGVLSSWLSASPL